MGAGKNPAKGTSTKSSRFAMIWAYLATVSLVAVLIFQSRAISANAGEPSVPIGPPPHSPPGDGDESPATPPSGKRNVIFMVSDGMGPASVALARNFFQHTQGTGLAPLAIDNFLVGSSRTQSSNSLVTDSAAGATAFSCGLKTYNGAIGINPDSQPCATVLEAAKLAGYRTGMVVTTRITDATPASFGAHAHDRSEEDFIAEQLVNWQGAHPFGHMVDLLIGGGRCHFLPEGEEGSCRRDDRNLVKDVQTEGWQYFETAEEMRSKPLSLPALGLFAPGDLPYSIDLTNDGPIPALNETAMIAVRALAEATKDSDQGFFLMVEGSRIDHAGHSNDPGAQVWEVIAYSGVFEQLAHYAQFEADVPTVVVSTSDHETGGLSVARQVSADYPDYLWYPEVLERAKHSTEYLAHELRHLDRALKKEKLHKYIRHDILGPNGLGLENIRNSEVKRIAKYRGNAQDHLAQLQNVRAQVGWATHGHSAVDVNVYAAASNHSVLDPIRRNQENTDIGDFLRASLNVTIDRMQELTEELRKKFGDKF